MADKYYIWLKQCGEGCDYTIACGERLDRLNATNMDDAIKEAKEDLLGWGEDIEDCKILVLAAEGKNLVKEAHATIEKEELAQEIADKKAQLAELQKEIDKLEG